jgi:hypothetical protein
VAAARAAAAGYALEDDEDSDESDDEDDEDYIPGQNDNEEVCSSNHILKKVMMCIKYKIRKMRN